MYTESNGIFRLIIVFSIVALLAGCGGGGGGGGTSGGEDITQSTAAHTGPDQAVGENGLVTLDASNSTGDIVSYFWKQTGGTQVTLSDPTAVRTTFQSPDVDENGVALTFELTVTDKSGFKSVVTCIVNITGKNDPPNAITGPTQTVVEGLRVALDGSNSTDTDDGIAQYEWKQISGPTITLTNANTKQPSFTSPDVDSQGAALIFELTVTDKGGLKSAAQCIVNVTAKNEPPKAITGPTQSVKGGDAVTLDASNSSDPDDGIASYAWQQKAGPSVTLSSAGTIKPKFTAPNVATALKFELTVTDKGGLKSTATCIVNITPKDDGNINPPPPPPPSNQPPKAIAGPDQTVPEGTLVTLDASNSSDTDSGIASFAWQQIEGPSVTLSDAGAIQPTFTAPNVSASGAALKFELTVTDNGGLKSTATCIVNVTDLNVSPQAITGPDQTVAEGALVSLDASNSTDPDDGIASFAWQQTEGPSITLSDASAIKPTFTAPNVADGGAALKFELTVTDNGGLKSTATCIVNVTGVNDPPTAAAGLDQTVGEGTLVTLDGSASFDPDDGIASYSWEQTAGAAITLTNPTTSMPTFTTPQVGPGGASYTFELTVTDNGGLKSTATCIVNVTWMNDPPTANAGPDQNVIEGTLVTLDGSSSLDTDDGIASYQWQQTAGPSVTLSNSGDSMPTFTSPVVGPSGAALTFTLTVTDNGTLHSTDTCTVNVQKSPKLLAQNVLYTAYAGIGYGRADYTTTDDDEFLYNVMLDDLNTLTGNLVQDTIFNDPAVLTKLLRLVLPIPLTTTFNYTYDSGVKSSITIDPGAMVNGYRSFTGALSVYFKSTSAYPWESCQYYGSDGGIDLTANVEGYFKATSNGLEYLFLSSVIIEPQSSLKVVYPKGEVRYNQWKIAYKAYYGEIDPTYPTIGSLIPVNMKVAPTLITQPVTEDDFRDYNLSGGFTLNGNVYEFGTSTEVINYQQKQEAGLTLISITGKLKVPGQTSQVIISTPTVNPIIRNITGFWTSGLMNFTGLDGASQVIFNSNYSCTLSGGSQGTWNVPAWQNALRP